MKRIGDFNRDEDLFGGGVVPREPERPAHGSVAMDKANVVLNALLAAGLKQPYEFDFEVAQEIWGTQLASFSLEELSEAVRGWIAQPEQPFPAVGDVVAVCNRARKEQAQERRITEARDWGGCEECDDNKWVRVYGAVIKTDIAKGVAKWGIPDGTVVETREHTMRPCSMCPDMKRAYELYSTGHFDAAHIQGGACKQCREYHETWKSRKINA